MGKKLKQPRKKLDRNKFVCSVDQIAADNFKFSGKFFFFSLALEMVMSEMLNLAKQHKHDQWTQNSLF